MSTPAFASRPALAGADAGNPYVLPKHLTDEGTGRGPRFSDPEWDFVPFVPRTTLDAKLRFDRLPDPVAEAAAREYFYSRLNRGVPNARRPSGNKPMKLTWVRMEFDRYIMVVEALAALGVLRLADATRWHFNAVVRTWQTEVRAPWKPRKRPNTDRRQRSRSDRPDFRQGTPIMARTIGARISTIKHMASHRRHMPSDAIRFDPWPGQAALKVAGHVQDLEENSTPRIPEPFLAPLLRAAVFYVTTASGDILAALAQLERMEQADQTRPHMEYGGAGTRMRQWIEDRRREGRGIPALPAALHDRAPQAPMVGGVVQAPNLTLTYQMADIPFSFHYRKLIWETAAELGFEEGGMDTPISTWPESGQPWRARFSRMTARDELYHLRVACWIVIAYLSGMRDCEVRELGRDCAVVIESHGGHRRFILHGRVFKGRELTGEEADWVVLEIVHRAVSVLLEVNDDPTHLFGFLSQQGHYTLLGDLPGLLDDFRTHVDALFSTPDAPYIPLHDGAPWYLNTRQFRRTLAWHIAHQPFGVVAGARQYKHAKVTMFEGYAGTSASGFAAEVAAEEAVAMLDYLEELYHDWSDGGLSTGGAAGRIGSEFDRIRRELGDLPGVVADAARLRTMLTHLAKTVHPGVLNDCFFQAATAVCVKRAKVIGRPVPQHNMCLHCPNARRSAVHLPRLVAARDQALDLHATCQGAGPVSKPQEVAITGYIAELDRVITDLAAQNLETEA